MAQFILARLGFFLGATCLVLSSAEAHHLMGLKTPSTFAEGFLSGLGHPLIGIDHLAVLVAIGVAVGMSKLSLLSPALFVGASIIGVGLHVLGATLPGSELLVAASVLVAGVMVARAAPLHPVTWGGLFFSAGLLHGYAFGESIFGAEPAPLWAYLAGLAIVQGFLSTAVALFVRWRTIPELPRVTGAAVAGVGLVVFTGLMLP